MNGYRVLCTCKYVDGARVYYVVEAGEGFTPADSTPVLVGDLYWRAFLDGDYNRAELYAGTPVPLERTGGMDRTPVTVEEAEKVLGFPSSGYPGRDNPCFDALRELVHAAS